ncbi:YoaK family protein [Streptomyces sp. NBC_00259]|uniref:YoaK family protein n=1 Tax=Streptomyces sp. NBC_00259 TaxID=2903643 RepID=UPI002E2999A1|nr:YoaK family protein [Streptomyces sp. NBC_00259]
MKPNRDSLLTWVMVALTMTTGLVEAVSFLVLGPVFTAVQTGNMLLMGFALAGVTGLSVAPCLASLVGFTVGTVLASRYESRAQVRGRRWFREALVVEAALLATAAVAAWQIEERGESLTDRHYMVAALVALAMGVRNVSTLRAGVPGMPTTVTTRAFTALIGGSPLALDSHISPGARNEIRRGASVAAMFTGGLLGAWMIRDERLDPAVVLLVIAALVLIVAIGATFLPRESVAE